MDYEPIECTDDGTIQSSEELLNFNIKCIHSHPDKLKITRIDRCIYGGYHITVEKDK